VPSPLLVVAAAVIHEGRLLVVSKKAAPAIFYLPGGKPEPGELRSRLSLVSIHPGERSVMVARI